MKASVQYNDLVWTHEAHPIDVLFKRFDVVLHEKFDDKYPNLDYDREVRYQDFHDQEKDEDDI